MKQESCHKVKPIDYGYKGISEIYLREDVKSEVFWIA